MWQWEERKKGFQAIQKTFDDYAAGPGENGDGGAAEAELAAAEEALAAAAADVGGEEGLEESIKALMDRVDSLELANSRLTDQQRRLESAAKSRRGKLRRVEQEVRSLQNRQAAKRLRMQKTLDRLKAEMREKRRKI